MKPYHFRKKSTGHQLVIKTKNAMPGFFKCGCGLEERIDLAKTESSNIYAEPICTKCYEDILKRKGEL